MVMDYSQLIRDILSANKTTKNSELYYDYDLLVQMRSTGIIDKYTMDVIYLKYKNEIEKIDNYRKIIYFKNNKLVSNNYIENKNFTTLNILIDHLFRIMCLRYVKEEVDDEIKSKIVSEDEKTIYELLAYVRDNK